MRWLYIIFGIAVLYHFGTIAQRIYYGMAHGSKGAYIDVAKEPVQSTLETPIIKTFTHSDGTYTYTLHSPYEISGKVIAASTYRLFDTNPFFDVDIALMWGRKLEDLNALQDKLTIFQGGRWVFLQSKRSLAQQDIQFLPTHFSNNHVIPKDNSDTIREVLKSIKKQDLVRIKGYLTDIKGPQGTVANSSRVRDDQGGGACEIIWVDEVQLGSRVFR